MQLKAQVNVVDLVWHHYTRDVWTWVKLKVFESLDIILKVEESFRRTFFQKTWLIVVINPKSTF